MSKLCEKSSATVIYDKYRQEFSFLSFIMLIIIKAPISTVYFLITFIVFSAAYISAPSNSGWHAVFLIEILICYLVSFLIFIAENNQSIDDIRKEKEQKVYDELCNHVNFCGINPYGIILIKVKECFFIKYGNSSSFIGIVFTLLFSLPMGYSDKIHITTIAILVFFTLFLITSLFASISKSHHKKFEEWLLRCHDTSNQKSFD